MTGINLPSVLVLMGGPDAEREVSLASGTQVAAALRDCGCYRVVEQVIDAPTADELHQIAESAGAEVVFPVLHGQWGEGGPLQELLEQLHLPYVGSNPRAAALAMDKLATKRLLAAKAVPTPRAEQLNPAEVCTISPPLVLKPIDDGSSVDLRICRTADEVAAAQAQLGPRRSRLMAEQYIAGREITVGVVLGQALPLIEIIPAAEYYDYDAKYTRDDTRYVVNPDLPQAMIDQFTALALLAHECVGCRDVSRVDFLLDQRGPWFLEINTMPGFTTHSLVPMAAAAIGLNMPDLCAKLVEAARTRRPRPVHAE